MTDEVLYAPATLDLIDRFLAEYRRAARPEQVLERYAARHPELAEEFRLQAGFSFIDPADEPTDLPDVTLLREIGRGGMGVVYEGWQESLARPVAVKLHRMTDTAVERSRFFHECRTLARLHQSSIVPVHTAGRSGPWLYYVMPLIEGATLAELIRRARAQATGPDPLPAQPGLVTGPPAGAWDLPADAVIRPGPAYTRSAVEVILQAAEAIEYAHREGVWHLDLKPANLMLDASGHTWIIDFGIAHQANTADPADPSGPVADTAPSAEATARPTTNAPFLTLAYAAPERWRGEADARSDVWGLGATLYELLTLRRPFPTNDPTELAAAVAGRDPVPAHRLADGLPLDLSAVCEKALAKSAEERYQSAGALAADLRRWLGGYETTARSWSPVARLVRRANRHKPWGVAAASAVVGVLVAFVLLWRQELLRADEARANQKAAEAEGQRAVAEEKLLREADSHAKSKIWSLLELARQRNQVPWFGRRAKVRELLMEAAGHRKGMAADATTPVLDVAFRSLYAESLGGLDAAPVPEADRAALPATSFRDWPVAIHPDGKALAVGTAKGPLVWRRGTPAPQLDPKDVMLPRSEVAFGPAGTFLVEMRSEEAGGGLRVWTPDEVRMRAELIAPGKPGSVVRAVGFDEKETRLWAAREDGRVSGWELPALTPVADWALAERPKTPVSAAAFGPGGGTVAFGDETGGVIGFAATGAVVLRRAALPAKPVWALAWHPDGDRLAVGTEDGTLHMFDQDGALLFRTNVSPHGVARIVFTPDGRWVTGHWRDSGGRFWDAWTGRPALITGSHVWGFARDGRTYAGSTPMGGANFGEVLYPEVVNRWAGHRASVVHLRWSADGHRLASLASDFQVRVWDVARVNGSVFAAVGPKTGGFWATQGHVALSPDGKRLAYASGGVDASKAAVYDVDANKELARWDLPGGFEKVTAAGPDRFRLVREQTNAKDGNLATVVYDLEPGKPLGEGRTIRPSAPGDVRRHIDHWLLPDGRHYVWSGPRLPPEARRVEIYDVTTGKLVRKIVTPPTTNDYAPHCLLTEDLKTLWVLGIDGGPRRYDQTTNDPPVIVPEAPLSVSADGRWLAFELGTYTGDLIPHMAIRPAPGDKPWVNLMCPDHHRPEGGRYLFSPDGRYLAWAGQEGTIYRVDLPLLADRVKQFEADMAKAK